MKRLSKIALEYYILNITVLPPAQDQNQYYSNLMTRLFSSRNGIRVGKDFVFRITQLDSIDNGMAFYGVISKYISLEDIEWVDDAEETIDYNHPDNVKGRKATYEFVFDPSMHKMVFVKKGRIDQEMKRKGAPLKSIVNVLKIGLDLVLDSEGKRAEVNIVQSEQIFEEIFSSPVKSLDLTVSYSNPGLGSDHEKVMDDYLRKANVGKARVNLQPDATGEIDTDEVFTKGLIDLARENGKVKARIQTEDGIKIINTEDHPEIGIAQIDKTGNLKANFIDKILTQLRKKSH